MYNVTTGALLANISTADPGPMVSGTGGTPLYMLDAENARVLTIAGAPAEVAQVIPLGLSTTAAAVDPATGTVFFSQGAICGSPMVYGFCANTSVGVLSPVTELRSAAWPVTLGGVGSMLFDPQNQRVYVLSECGAMAEANPSCLSGVGAAVSAYSVTGRWLGETLVHEWSASVLRQGMALDTAAGDLVVLTLYDRGLNLTVLNASTLEKVFSEQVTGPGPIAGSLLYDPVSNIVYVNAVCYFPRSTNFANCLWGFNGTTFAQLSFQALPVQGDIGPPPQTTESLAFDAANNTVLWANGVTVLTLNASTAAPTGLFALPDDAAAYDPVNEVVYALGANLTEINGTTGAVISSTPTTPTSPFGPFGFGQGGLVVDPTTGTAVVWYQEAGTLTFVPGPGPRAYPVAFPKSGLPSSTNWTVTVAGHSETGDGNLSFFLPNGTYPYSIAVVPGFHESSIPATGMVRVMGGSLVETLANYSATTYPITFKLAPGSVSENWILAVRQIAPSPGGWPIPPCSSLCGTNGTYAYVVQGLAAGTIVVGIPPAGEFTIGGRPVSFTFALETGPTPPLTFHETGLPVGTWWCAFLEGATGQCSTSTSVTFENLTGGQYSYRLLAVPGYVSASSSGLVDLSTHGTVVKVTFTPSTYRVTLAEVGLRPGTRWSVRLEGTPQVFSTTERFLTLELPNGTYNITPVIPPGYALPRTPGAKLWTVRVSGFPVAMEVVVIPVLFNVTFNETGLPPGAFWCMTVPGTGEHCATNPSIVFTEMNGTYRFRVGSVHGYFHNQGSPSRARVHGAAVVVAVQYIAEHAAPVLYAPAQGPLLASVPRRTVGR